MINSPFISTRGAVAGVNDVGIVGPAFVIAAASGQDFELIIAHLLGRNESGAPLDPDVRNALVHERYTNAARLIRGGQ